MRVELRDGQWAELRERITHGEDKELKKMYVRGRDDPGAVYDAQSFMARLFLRDWSVRDLNGSPIALTDTDALDRAPADIVDALYDAVDDLYQGATVPKATTPPSSAESPSVVG